MLRILLSLEMYNCLPSLRLDLVYNKNLTSLASRITQQFSQSPRGAGEYIIGDPPANHHHHDIRHGCKPHFCVSITGIISYRFFVPTLNLNSCGSQNIKKNIFAMEKSILKLFWIMQFFQWSNYEAGFSEKKNVFAFSINNNTTFVFLTLCLIHPNRFHEPIYSCINCGNLLYGVQKTLLNYSARRCHNCI